MSWQIVYTAGAKSDLRSLYEYIAYHLCAPDTAAKQAGQIMREIQSLDEMPLRYPLYMQEPWRTQGLRYLRVNHYFVFYFPVEKENTVYIVRIMYTGRDIQQQLLDTTIDF